MEQVWLTCGLDMRILQSHYTLLLNIISNSYRTDDKNTSHPRKNNIKEGITATLSPEVANTLLDCLSKHNFPFLDGASGHRQQEAAAAGSLLPNSNNIKPPSASKRRNLLEGDSAAHYSFSPPAKEAIRSVLSSKAEARPLVTSMKKAAKPVPKNKSKDSSSATVAVGLSVACIALVALICLCCCACHGNHNPASPYDLRDDKPLLSLNLSDLSGRWYETNINAARLFVSVQYVAWLYVCICVLHLMPCPYMLQVLPVSLVLPQSM